MYPPFSEILKLTVVDKDEEKAWKLADAVAAFLREHYQAEQWERTEILGPFPSGVAKVRDLYRINIVIKSQAMEKVKACLWSSEYKIMRNIYFDVDPITAM